MSKFNRAWEKQNSLKADRSEQEFQSGEEEILPPKSQDELAGEQELTPEGVALRELDSFEWVKSHQESWHHDEEGRLEPTDTYEFYSVEDFLKRVDPKFLESPTFWAMFLKDEKIRENIEYPAFAFDRELKHSLYQRIPESVKGNPAVLPDLIKFFDRRSVIDDGYFNQESYDRFHEPSAFKEHKDWHKGNLVFADLFRRKGLVDKMETRSKE